MSKQKGQRPGMWKRQALGAVLIAGAALSASADTINSIALYSATSLVTAPNIDLKQLDLSGSGTLTVKLTDLKWPDLLGTLSFTLFDATHTLGTYALSNVLSGSNDFAIDTAGTYYGSIFARPADGKSAGLYSAQITFLPSAPPVPLPATAWLLLSGIAGLAAIRPKQKLSQMCA